MPVKAWIWVVSWSVLILGGLLYGTYRRDKDQAAFLSNLAFTGFILAPLILFAGFLPLTYLALLPIPWIRELGFMALGLPALLALGCVYAWNAGRTMAERGTLPALFIASGVFARSGLAPSSVAYQWTVGLFLLAGVLVSVVSPFLSKTFLTRSHRE